MTILASEAASIVEGSAAQSAATTIGKRAKKARPAAGATRQMNRQHLSRVAPKKPTASRRASTSHSYSVGGSHYKSYKGSSGKKDMSLKLKGPNMGGGKVGTLIIEWAIGAGIIFWALMDGTKKTSSFQQQAHSFFWRFFGWTFTFFVLALLMRGKNTGKFAVLFGALLDVTMVVSAIITGSFGTLQNLFTGQATADLGKGSTNPQGTPAPSGPNGPPVGPFSPGPGSNVPQNNPSAPQSPTNPNGIPNPLHDPGGFFKHLIFNPPGFLKFFDPFTLFHGLF